MYTIHLQLFIFTDSKSLFDAVTLPEHLTQWWPLRCSGSPQMGNLYNYNFGDLYDWYAEVSSCVTNESIEFKMTKADHQWMPTSFGYKIIQNEKNCTLKFYHQGWQDESEHFCIASFCWAMLINGLKQYLEKGVVIPFENRN